MVNMLCLFRIMKVESRVECFWNRPSYCFFQSMYIEIDSETRPSIIRPECLINGVHLTKGTLFDIQYDVLPVFGKRG